MDTLEEITIYRCLRSKRLVSGSPFKESRFHDECADIISRNPDISFEPGLSGIEADHMVYEGTNWDVHRHKWPERYLLNGGGRLGTILVSVRLRLGRATGIDDLEGPQFYPGPHLEAFGYTCYKAGNTSLIRVRIEEIVKKPI